MTLLVQRGTLNWNLLTRRLYQRLKIRGVMHSPQISPNSSQRFRDLVIDSPWPLLITNDRFKILYVNPAWEKLTGYTLSEVIYKNPSFHMSPSTPKVMSNRMYRAISQGKSYVTDHIINKRKDGSEFQIQSIFFSVKKKNQILHYVQLSHDITEQKKHEVNAAQFEAIINSSNDAIFSVVPELIIVSLNPATEKMYGYTKEELMGKSLTVLVPPQRYKEIKQLYSDTQTSYVNYETERMRKDGSLINVAITVSPIYDKKKKLTGFSVIHRDITERKKLDEQKKSFLSAASHELKTPITTLKLLLQIHKKRLEEKMDGELVGKEVEAVDRELNHLIELINDLLDVSRFETGKFILNLESFNLSKLIQSTVRKVQLLYKVKIKSSVKEDFFVIGDKSRIEQVLTNILTNAVKHSKSEKPIEVLLSLNKRTYIVSVKDYGVGIPKSKLPLIFEQFYQGGNNPQGFGLGLFISKTIIELHKGKISVKSKENHGSIFTFSLPIIKIN
jgi:two-component system, OmpR family, sensor histidine kinase VicK